MKHRFLTWALALPITPAQFKVLCVIHSEPRRVIKQSRIIKLSGVSERSVGAAIASLEKIGAIHRVFRQTTNGLMLPCSYKINTNTPAKFAPLNPAKYAPQRRVGKKGSSGVIKKPRKTEDRSQGNVVEFPSGKAV